MKYEIAAMLQTGGGAIVNTSSVAGHIGWLASLYVASKHAVEGLTKAAALNSPSKASASIRWPPGRLPPIWSTGWWAKQAIRGTSYCRCIRSAEFGASEEIAAAVLYLASDAAKFTTGTTLLVDGGWTAE